jgi:hypothetical protein
METIYVGLDKKLLKAAALDRHLKYLHVLELEDQDRRGYLAHPQREEEFRILEYAASWPRP